MDGFEDWGPIVGLAMMLVGLIGMLIDWFNKGCFFCG